MVGYDDVISIEHEDDLIEADEGLAKAASLLRSVLLERPVGLRWWEAVGAPSAATLPDDLPSTDRQG